MTHHQPPVGGSEGLGPWADRWGILFRRSGASGVVDPCAFGSTGLKRGIVFIDLAIAQVAGLGVTAAMRWV